MDAQNFWSVIGNFNQQTKMVQIGLFIFVILAIALSYMQKAKWSAKFAFRKDAEKAIKARTLYVYEKDNNIAGSIIVNKIQPTEYTSIVWGQSLTDDKVMVIHLLMMRPSMAGNGIASFLVKYAMELAEINSCKVLRLDTGSQNIPAISLYKKLGFQIVATASMKVGNTIEHSEHLFLEKVL